jgi:type IX secretion system PorP/SprF family membrane protein
LLFKEFILLIFLLQSFSGLCQDIHFSQFAMSPLSLNPALTGFFDGDYRLAGNARSQWGSIPVPYSTFSASADRNFAIKHLKKDRLGMGLFISSDKAGDADFGTTNISASLSYSKNIGPPSGHQAISIGIQPGFVQRSIDFQKLRFDNQYNGDTFDPFASPGENFSNSNFSYFNIAAGLQYYYKPAPRRSYSLGAGVFNITRPPQSFFAKDDIRLFKKYTFHGQGQFKTGAKTDLLPAFQIMQQHNYTEILLGASLKYILIERKGVYEAVRAGVWLRSGDAVILSAGYDYKQFNFGLSYDINYSNLRPASNGRGGLEFAIIYVVKNVPAYINKRICPAYF